MHLGLRPLDLRRIFHFVVFLPEGFHRNTIRSSRTMDCSARITTACSSSHVNVERHTCAPGVKGIRARNDPTFKHCV